jgi:hypothetical protein
LDDRCDRDRQPADDFRGVAAVAQGVVDAIAAEQIAGSHLSSAVAGRAPLR